MLYRRCGIIASQPACHHRRKRWVDKVEASVQMESIELLILLSLVAAAIAVIGCLAIYNHKRRQRTQPAVAERAQPTAVEETQATVGEAQPAAAEEPQPIITEEAEPTAVAETKPASVEELQPTIAEETQPTVVGEARATAPEEIRPTVAEENQLQVAKEISRKREGGRQKPEKRGGRPRGPAPGGKKGPTPETKSLRLKPEIVCWKRERQWIPVVEVPEELLENQNLVVIQDEAALIPDDSEGCWRLCKTSGEVIVQWSEAEGPREMRIPLGEDEYLLFKLSGPDLSQGRKVNSPSSGSYLVIAPDDWERDESLSGPPPVMPESVTLDGYRAHFFELEKGSNSRIAFRTSKGQSVVIESKKLQFELVGNRVNDASDTMGPLFAGKPPRVRSLDPEAWKRVSTIVIGEEGSGRGRWRTEMAPDPNEMEQDLPSELAAKKGGWYFVRFYDTSDNLIDSLDFRFLCALKEIRIPQLSPLPTQDGYSSVCVEFLHEPGCIVQPVDSLTSIQIERSGDKTVLTIPPHPACDETHWRVSSKDGAEVKVTILVERLWWAVGEEDKKPPEWKDRPLTLSRDDFAATSRKALRFRLPRRRWVNKISVGFRQQTARSYEVKVMEETVAVPLRDFGDSEKMIDSTEQYLKIWIEHNGTWKDGVVAFIPAPQPKIVSPPPQTVSPSKEWQGCGRKKVAVARAVLRKKAGMIKVNGNPLEEYFSNAPDGAKQFIRRLLEMPKVNQLLSQMELSIIVTGSSPTTTRQAKAVAHALARALMDYDPKLKRLLKQAGFGGVRVKRKHLSQLEA